MKTLEEITRIVEKYPASWRRWCDAPESGGCACMGCVRNPAPAMLPGVGDTEGWPFPNPNERLTREEMMLYLAEREKAR